MSDSGAAIADVEAANGSDHVLRALTAGACGGLALTIVGAPFVRMITKAALLWLMYTYVCKG